MPDYTVYAKIFRKGKRKVHRIKNTPVLTIHQTIVDYQDLKTTLIDAGRAIYFHPEYDHQTVTEISLEKHLSGKYVSATTSYRRSKIRYNREPQLRAIITYNPNLNEIKITKASFITPEFYDKCKAEYDYERGKKWQPQKVVPVGFEALLNNDNPDLLFVDLLNIKTTSYMTEPKDRYAPMQEKRRETGSYAGFARGSYAPRNLQTVEQDRAEKEKQL